MPEKDDTQNVQDDAAQAAAAQAAVTTPAQPTQDAAAEPHWLPSRLEQAKRSTEKALLETLGVKSLDEAKKVLADAAELRQAQMSDADKAKEEAEKTRQEAEDLKAQLAQRDLNDLRKKIASELKLPEALAARLTGTTEDEIKADAEALVKAIPAVSNGTSPTDEDGDLTDTNTDPFLKGLLGA